MQEINPQAKKKNKWCHCDAVKCDGSAHVHFEDGSVECADEELEPNEK